MKRPIEVEAIRLDLSSDWKIDEAINFCEGKAGYGPSVAGDYNFCITTLEGVMTASDGDWIIKGVQGEFYPCKPDIFEETYEWLEEGEE